MRKSKRKVLCLLLAGIMLFGMMPATVSAEENAAVFDMALSAGAQAEGDFSYTGINDFTVNPNARIGMITGVSLQGSCSRDGITVVATVTANEVATKIGVQNVIVQKKTSSGWLNVATSSGNSATNASTCSMSGLVTNVEVGQTYRILATHYAYLSNGYTEVPNQTDGFVYAY